MRVKVLMVGPGKATTGGITTVVETILPALVPRVDLLYLPTVQRRSFKGSGKISLRNIALAVSQYGRYLGALSRFRPQVVHIHTSQGVAWLKDTFFVLVGKAYRRRVILHVHAADFDELYGDKSRLVQAYTRRIMRLADAIIAVSTEWRECLARIVPSERLYTFRNCIDVDAIVPHSPDGSSNGVTALFMGSVGPRKGAFDLLAAMGRLKSNGHTLRLWIAGYEEREKDLDRAGAQIKDLQIEETCQLMGIIRGSKKASLLSEADLFVLPSYHEGLPMAILEAMAAGLAIVSTPVGGIPEVVQDGHNGFLVTPGDVNMLADRLSILACDAQLCQLMGQRSRRFAEQQLNVRPYVEKLADLYGSIANL